MITITATNARKTLFDVIKGANQRHEIYHINHKSGGAVLMSEKEFDSLQETLELLSSKGFCKGFAKAKEEIENGETRSFEDVFGEPQ